MKGEPAPAHGFSFLEVIGAYRQPATRILRNLAMRQLRRSFRPPLSAASAGSEKCRKAPQRRRVVEILAVVRQLENAALVDHEVGGQLPDLAVDPALPKLPPQSPRHR